MTTSPNPQTGKPFDQRRAAIVAAATVIMNRHGVKGMTMPDVAARVQMSATGLTYYFKRKEDLAVACLEGGIASFDELVSLAAAEPDPPARVRALLAGYLAVEARVREGARAPIAILSDIRALNEPAHGRLEAAYRDMLARASGLFAAAGYRWMNADDRTARAHMVLEQLYWSVAWLRTYDRGDLPRIAKRMFDVLANGIAGADRSWRPGTVPRSAFLPGADAADGREVFLQAATRLINARGYRGASVERISAALNVTKGSFYHHHEAKDDLVAACFKRSFAVMRRMQRWLAAQPGDQWWKLSTAAAELVDLQLSDDGPLLRTSAFSALPIAIQYEMVVRSYSISGRFAGMMSDGWAEGSIRPVDPVIAAQMLMAMINAAADLPAWIPGIERHTAGQLYARPLLVGIFSR